MSHEDTPALAGMITHHLGRFPEPGETLAIKGLSLEILEVDQKRIKKLRVRKQASEQ